MEVFLLLLADSGDYLGQLSLLVAMVAQMLASPYCQQSVVLVVDVAGQAVADYFGQVVASYRLANLHCCWLAYGLLDATYTVAWSHEARSVLLVEGLFFMLTVAFV